MPAPKLFGPFDAADRARRSTLAFAAAYYWIMRQVVGMKGMPAHGADFFLIDRAVIDVFKQFPERNVSVLALIAWIGFRQDTVEYDKQPRVAGRSGWATAAKINLVVDSVTAFSDFPIRFCWHAGLGRMGSECAQCSLRPRIVAERRGRIDGAGVARIRAGRPAALLVWDGGRVRVACVCRRPNADRSI